MIQSGDPSSPPYHVLEILSIQCNSTERSAQLLENKFLDHFVSRSRAMVTKNRQSHNSTIKGDKLEVQKLIDYYYHHRYSVSN